MLQMTTGDSSASGPFLALLLTALVVMGSPGPATIGAAASASAFGLRRSMPYLAGSIVGTSVVLIVVMAGLASLVLAEPRLRVVLLVLAVGYLAYLAARIATAAPPAAGAADSRAPGWASGLVVAVANPKAYTGLGALVTGAAVELQARPVDTIATTAILVLLIVLVHVGWAVAGASFAAALRRPRISRAVNVVMAAALLASTAPMIVDLLP